MPQFAAPYVGEEIVRDKNARDGDGEKSEAEQEVQHPGNRQEGALAFRETSQPAAIFVYMRRGKEEERPLRVLSLGKRGSTWPLCGRVTVRRRSLFASSGIAPRCSAFDAPRMASERVAGNTLI